jgi:hypothetical protein
VFLVLVLVLAGGLSALAQCGVSTKLAKPSSWQPQMGGEALMNVALSDDSPSIVGMWHVVWTAHSMNGESIPSPGVRIDNSVVVWHADGTEIMNSSRPAQDGNFCLGVWKQTGKLSYFLNHIPWQGNDPSGGAGGIGNPTGGAQILEQVTLNPDGNHYSGKFSLTAYDSSGNVEVVFTGTLSATRITPGTKFTDLL